MITSGLEKMNSAKFIKDYTIFRRSLLTRQVSLDANVQLPNRSILHLLDNMNRGVNVTDVPDVENIFLINETFKRYIYHSDRTMSKEDVLFTSSTRYRYMMSGMSKTFVEWNKKYRKFIQPIVNLGSVIDKESCLVAINHNPLWRFKVQGKLASYYKFDLILRNLVTFLLSIQPNKYQFVYIPLSSTTYTKNNIIKPITSDLNPSTLSHETNDYYFLVQLLSYFYTNPNQKNESLFKHLAGPYSQLVHFIFQVKDKAMIFNLDDMKNVVNNQASWVMFLEAINRLKLSGIMSPEQLANMSQDDIEAQSELEEVKVGKPELLGDINTPSYTEELPKVQPVIKLEEVEPVNIVEELRQETTTYIEQANLTPAQKLRVKKLSDKHTSIILDGKPIAEYLSKEPDLTVGKTKLDFLEDELIDKSMSTSSIVDFDKQYMKELFHRDMLNVLMSVTTKDVTADGSRLFLTDLKTEPQIDELNSITQYTATYEDIHGEKHTIKWKFPNISEDGSFTVNGITSKMKKQQINTPICKISPTRVSLSGSYKTLVEKNINKAKSFDAFIKKYVAKINTDKEIVKVKYGGYSYGTVLPSEYTTLGKSFNSIRIGNHILDFNYDNRSSLSPDILDKENEYGVYFGNVVGKPNQKIYIGMNNQITIVDIVLNEVVNMTTIVDLLAEESGVVLPMVPEFTELKILDQKLPIIFVLAYRFGLTNTLNYLNIDHQLIDKGVRIDKAPTDLVIRFQDKTLVFNRYPIQHSHILAGLLNYKTNKIEFDKFNEKDVYYSLLQDKGISINYIKGIDRFYELFLDPITRDVLKLMNEPTNIRDLLIRASGMLATEAHVQPASMANHRLRTYDRFNSILYDEIARRLAETRSKNLRGKISINPEAVFLRIIQDQAVQAVEDINPLQDIKELTGYTHSGVGGRTSQAFVKEDRKYPNDGVGIVSEAVPDSGKVALNAFTSMDPKLSNLRGLYDIDDDKVEPTELLSITSLLLPKVTADDVVDRMI